MIFPSNQGGEQVLSARIPAEFAHFVDDPFRRKAGTLHRYFRLFIFATTILNLQGISANPQFPARAADAAEAADWETCLNLLTSSAKDLEPQADGMTALHWAAFHGNPEVARKCLAVNLPVNAVTYYQVTPLVLAAQQGHSDVIRLLIESEADIGMRTQSGASALMYASRAGHRECVRALTVTKADIDQTDKQGQTALMWAAAAGRAECVELLLRAKASAELSLSSGFSAVTLAAREGHSGTIDVFLKHGIDVNSVMQPKKSGARVPRKGTSALILAVESGHFELAMKLVNSGADPNDQRSGFAPLHVLTWVRKPNWGENAEGDPSPKGSGMMTSLQFAEAIIKAGADPNLRLSKGNGGRASLHKKGATPLLLAGKTADLPLIRLLVKHGADPTITNVSGTNALMAAAGVGVKAVGEEAGTVPEICQTIEYLIQQGLDVNTVDDNQETAIHGAAYRNFPEVIDLLAARGASAKIWDHKNKWGWTPVMIGQGHRPGSFKPSPPTVAALKQARLTSP